MGKICDWYKDDICDCFCDGLDVSCEHYSGDLRRDMTYISDSGKQIVFDDYVDNTVEYNSYWVGMCKHCHDKYKNILGNRVDDCGSGFCSVKGCNNEADYYVDFDMNEVAFIDDFLEDLAMEQREQM